MLSATFLHHGADASFINLRLLRDPATIAHIPAFFCRGSDAPHSIQLEQLVNQFQGDLVELVLYLSIRIAAPLCWLTLVSTGFYLLWGLLVTCILQPVGGLDL
jgi:hypothetical protein